MATMAMAQEEDDDRFVPTIWHCLLGAEVLAKSESKGTAQNLAFKYILIDEYKV